MVCVLFFVDSRLALALPPRRQSSRPGAIDSRFDLIDSRFERVESSLGRLERKLDGFIDTQMRANEIAEQRLRRLEARG